MSLILNLNDFCGADDRERFAAALREAKAHPGSTLIVPAGEYIITSGLARKTRDDVIAGRHGENPEDDMFHPDFDFTVGLSFSGHQGTTLEAWGAKLMIDGFMEPVSLDHCEGVTLRGLTIDHVRKPFSFGVIEAYTVEDEQERTGHIIVRFDPSTPVDENTIMPRYCAYDYQTSRFNLDMRVISREYLGDQQVLFRMKRMPRRDLTGQEFYVWHSFHYRPGILIEEAKDITLQGVTIHSQPGMGIVGHRSENILMDQLKVVPSHPLHMSTNTDATHFTSCKGEIKFLNCAFDGHGDDATNVHTFYHDIQPLSGDTYRGSVAVKTHSLTLDYPDVGDEMELVEKDSLELRGVYHVLSVEPHGKELYYIATLDGELPADAAEKCYLSNVTRAPQLKFIGCTANNHWARSVLIKTRNALVENCIFTGAVLQAIHVAAEAWWHEGVACKDIVIRNNRFVNCGIGGHADVGGVKAEMSVDRKAGTPQERITIENNVFDLPEVKHAVHVSNTDGVFIRGNRYFHCDDPVEIVDCTGVDVQ